MAKKTPPPAADAATQEANPASGFVFLENWHHDGAAYKRGDCADSLDPDSQARLLKSGVIRRASATRPITPPAESVAATNEPAPAPYPFPTGEPID